MRYFAAGLLFLLVLTGLELHWTPWRFVTGAFGPRRFVMEGPGGDYGVVSYDFAYVFPGRKPWIPRVGRMLIAAGPFGTIHAAHVVALGVASVAGTGVLLCSRAPREQAPPL
jgi:hypothetical protein